MLHRALALLLLASCSTEPEDAGPDAVANAVSLFDRARAPLEATNDDVLRPAPQPLNPRLRIMWDRSGSACRPRSGANPVIVLMSPVVPEVRPRVGTRIQFAVMSCWPSTETPTTFIMAIGTRLLQPAFNLDGSGAPGCQLLVAWDHLAVITAGDQGSGMWQRKGGGRVDFDWTPLPMHANTRWYIQAGIVAPGENQANLLTTSAVEMWVGPGV